MSNKPVNKVITETGAVSDDVVKHSNPTSPQAGNLASSVELAAALESSQAVIADKDARIAALEAQLSEKNKSSASSDDAIVKIANMLASLVPQAQPAQGPTESESINKSTDYNNQKVTIDGRSLMEAQAAVNEFKNEPKVPVSIPKSLANTFGPFLAVSVNGVRVAVNCDGKTYLINETHAEHIRERIAKVDILNAKPGEDVTIRA